MTAPMTNTSAVRVGDRDRNLTATRLGQALAQGYLDMTEYERRVGSAFAAQSRATSTPCSPTCPCTGCGSTTPLDAPPGNRPPGSGCACLAAYALMVVVVLTVWLAVALSGGTWYFWPIWPILGAGIGVVGHVIPARFAVRSPGCRRAP